MELIITNKELFDKRPLLDKELKEKWLELLKSGKYNKGKKRLCSNINGKEYHCCLGVLCEILEFKKEILDINSVKKKIYSFDKETDLLPIFIDGLENSGYFKGFVLRLSYGKLIKNLAELNDEKETFDEVIDVIEKYF